MYKKSVQGWLKHLDFMILPDSQLKEAYDKFLKIKEKSMKEREEKMSTIKKMAQKENVLSQKGKGMVSGSDTGKLSQCIWYYMILLQ